MHRSVQLLLILAGNFETLTTKIIIIFLLETVLHDLVTVQLHFSVKCLLPST